LDLLDRGARRLDADLVDQPAVRANLYAVISEAYHGVGHADSAEAFAHRALALRRPDGPAPDAGRAVESQVLLGRALGSTDPEGSAAALREAVAQARQIGDDAVLLDALEAQGMTGLR